MHITKEIYENNTKIGLMNMFQCTATGLEEAVRPFTDKFNDFYKHCEICGKLYKGNICSHKCEQERMKKLTNDRIDYVSSNKYRDILLKRSNISLLDQDVIIDHENDFFIDVETRKHMLDIFRDICMYNTAKECLDYFKFKHLTVSQVEKLANECGHMFSKINLNRLTYEDKLVWLRLKLTSLGFNFNTKPFMNTHTIPNFINEDAKIVLDFNSEFWLRDKNIYNHWRIVKRDYFEIIRRRGLYSNHGYQYYCIWEKDFIEFILNTPINLEQLKKYNSVKQSFYIAGGWFTPLQEITLNKLNNVIDECGYSNYKPNGDGINISALKQDRWLYESDFLDVYCENIKAISESEAIFASVCENDSGTIYEVAIGQGMGIPVFIFDDSLQEGKKINIMFSMNADGIFTDIKDVKNFLTKGVYKNPNDIKYE